MDTADDAALADFCRKGDTAAFEVLVRRHQRTMMNIAFRITGQYEDACEVVQDAFVTAWKKIAEFRGDSRFSTWLTAIVMNLSRNRREQTGQRTRREGISLDTPPEGSDTEHVHEHPSNLPSALERLEAKELQQTLHHCMDALEQGFREVLVLRDMQELSYEDIGSALGLREGTVKSRLFRARDAVKECLKKALVAL